MAYRRVCLALRPAVLAVCAGALAPWVLHAPGVLAMAPQVTDKSTLTPAQRKLDSHLLQEIARADRDPQAGPPPGGEVTFDRKHRALVDVRAPVTSELNEHIVRLKGTVVSSSVDHHSIIAWMPLGALERLAEDPAVRAIVPPSGVATNAIKK